MITRDPEFSEIIDAPLATLFGYFWHIAGTLDFSRRLSGRIHILAGYILELHYRLLEVKANFVDQL
ncbi:MAG: hypothetical protein KGQ58_09175 [Proteobacteria bacterium]|nr:hypothetical protein [Pseudomonadota bacterium]